MGQIWGSYRLDSSDSGVAIQSVLAGEGPPPPCAFVASACQTGALSGSGPAPATQCVISSQPFYAPKALCLLSIVMGK